MHAHSPASIRLMMALTPKRLFLSLSASLSLFSALTLSSHAHLWSLKLSLKMRVSSNELFSTLKRECHDNQWFFLVILCGENNGGHHDRSRKSMGEPRTADRMNDARAVRSWPRRSQAGRGDFFKMQLVVVSFAFDSGSCWTRCPPQTAVFTARTFLLLLCVRPWKDPLREVVSGVFVLAPFFSSELPSSCP